MQQLYSLKKQAAWASFTRWCLELGCAPQREFELLPKEGIGVTLPECGAAKSSS